MNDIILTVLVLLLAGLAVFLLWRLLQLIVRRVIAVRETPVQTAEPVRMPLPLPGDSRQRRSTQGGRHYPPLPLADDNAPAVLAAAQEQAARIIREAKLFNRRAEKDMTEQLQTMVDRSLAAADERLQEMTDHFQVIVEQRLREHADRLLQHSVSLERELTETDAREQVQLRKKLARYEQQRIAALEQRIAAALPGIIQQAAGRSIPLAEHEKLVHEAVAAAAEVGWPAA